MIKFHSASLVMAVMLCSLITATYGQTASGETPLASISGTVLDVNSGMVSGAQVTLLALDHPASRTALSDDQDCGKPAKVFNLNLGTPNNLCLD